MEGHKNGRYLSKSTRTIYCHFAFKRPKGKNYGIFAVAFYSDFEGKKKIMKTVRKYELWENHQFITAIQAYENALAVIYENQGLMKAANIGQIMLVTDNSTLAGWIVNHKKNKAYTAYMERAVKPYRVGSYKEIVLGIGLCQPREYEKAYKYCKEEYVENKHRTVTKTHDDTGVSYKFKVEEFKTVFDMLSEDKAVPEISGISTI